MLRDTLVAEGVAEEAVEVIPREPEAVLAALERAQPGDLVLIFGDQIRRSWKQISTYAPDLDDAEAAPPPRPVPIPETPTPASFSLAIDEPITRDERGVWITREEED